MHTKCQRVSAAGLAKHHPTSVTARETLHHTQHQTEDASLYRIYYRNTHTHKHITRSHHTSRSAYCSVWPLPVPLMFSKATNIFDVRAASNTLYREWNRGRCGLSGSVCCIPHRNLFVIRKYHKRQRLRAYYWTHTYSTTIYIYISQGKASVERR